MSKCPYCDFNSHALRETLPEERYVEALLADLAAQARAGGGSRGGEPVPGRRNTQPVHARRRWTNCSRACAAACAVAADAEITLEANPATVERGRFAEYRAIGINRVSLGAQSFDTETLKALGRIHQPADVLRAAEELHAAAWRISTWT